MDGEPMLRQHVDAGADVTVGCIEVSRAEASCFGVMAEDEADRITVLVEKPRSPQACRTSLIMPSPAGAFTYLRQPSCSIGSRATLASGSSTTTGSTPNDPIAPGTEFA
jgi:hypothetical protein